jgi:glucuronoarabinoxylan endo-1,4-beta-xylanase
MKEVLNDIKTAGGSVRLSSMPPTSGGTILEAEMAVSNGPQKAAGSSAYTGTGYLDFNSAADGSWVEWTFDAPQAGTYILEIRYALEQGRYPSRMTVNGNRTATGGLITGQGVGDIVLWTTGGKSTWAWDRKAVVLRKGTNTIRLTPGGTPLIDHLNVLYGGPVSEL